MENMTQETKGPFSVPRKERKTYFLKLTDKFFKDKTIKLLRKRAGGDTYTVILLKLFLQSLEDENHLYYDGIVPTFEEELALSIDEKPEDIKVVLDFLATYGWLIEESEGSYYLPKSAEMSGSITESGLRKQRQREREKELKAGQIPQLSRNSHADVTQLSASLPPYISISKSKYISISKDRDRSKEGKELSELVPEAFMEGKEKSSPALPDVQQYAEASHFYAVSPDDFFGMFSSQDWTVEGKDITDWRSLYLELERLARNEEGEGGIDG